MSDKIGSIPDWVKFGSGAVLTILSFLPLAKFRFNQQRHEIDELKDSIENVRSEKTRNDELIVAMTSLSTAIASLTNATAEQTTSNVRVHDALIDVKNLYKRVESLETKNAEDHSTIKQYVNDNYLSKTTFEMLRENLR